MKGWIIYTDYATRVHPERYELNRFIKEAKKENIEITIIQPEQIDLVITKENIETVFFNGFPIELPDFVLPRMGAGTTYPALALIRHLEKSGVFILNSADSIHLTKDKLHTHQVLIENGISTPKTMFMKSPIDADLVEEYLYFPIIVKTICGSQGSGVTLSENKKNLEDLVMLLDAANSTVDIILQEYITTSIGCDLRVLVIDNKVIGCMQRKAANGNFKANFSAGGTVENYKITEEIERISIQTSKALDLNVTGIDLLFGKDCLYVCEATSSPGFEGIESCCDINVPKQIYQYLKNKLNC